MSKSVNSKHYAFPIAKDSDGVIVNHGLTKREYFAAMALQGILSNDEMMSAQVQPGIDITLLQIATNIANDAVFIADALLDRLTEQ